MKTEVVVKTLATVARGNVGASNEICRVGAASLSVNTLSL